MKYCVALYINNKQRIGIVSLYSQLLQNDSRVADDFRAASNWQWGGDGLPLAFIEEIESVLGMV